VYLNNFLDDVLNRVIVADVDDVLRPSVVSQIYLDAWWDVQPLPDPVLEIRHEVSGVTGGQKYAFV